MAKELIKVSLTEFIRFVNKSGSPKATVVKVSKNKREEEYEHYKDYWLKFRDKVKFVHKRDKGRHDQLRDLLDEINEDKIANYKEAIEGYIKFWKKRKIEWFNPPKKTWKSGDLRIQLNPEIGITVRNKLYVIKLHLSANDIINKRHADLILNLMEKELRNKVNGDEVTFAVLDVKRGKLFENKNKDTTLFPLLKGEARSFETIWKSI